MTPKQFFSIVFATYVIVHAEGGDRYQLYEGRSQTEVRAIFAAEGKTVDFIDQREYDDFQAARAVQKAAARTTVKSSTATTTQKVDALILLLDMDR